MRWILVEILLVAVAINIGIWNEVAFWPVAAIGVCAYFGGLINSWDTWRMYRCVGPAVVLGLVVTSNGQAAIYKTPNFTTDAPTAEIAEQCGKRAEQCRDELAIKWLGEKLPGNWHKPCDLKVNVGQIGSGGATTFAFDNGEVFGWRMNVQGSLDDILESVIPHEVSHTIFACYFRRPIPRWADEGAAQTVESSRERHRHYAVLQQSPMIPLPELLAMKDYPRDMRKVVTLYSQSHAIATYLIQRGGHKRFLDTIHFANTMGWEKSLQSQYGIGVAQLDVAWREHANQVIARKIPLDSNHLVSRQGVNGPCPEGCSPGCKCGCKSPAEAPPQPAISQSEWEQHLVEFYELRETVASLNLGVAPQPGPQGDRGATGDTGPMPRHEIKDGAVRFETAEGWGEWIQVVTESKSTPPTPQGFEFQHTGLDGETKTWWVRVKPLPDGARTDESLKYRQTGVKVPEVKD